MSTFVNYGKRGVQLPAGCKDLIDVLHGQRAAKSGAGVAAIATKITRNSQATISVTDLLGPITELLKSKAWNRALSVSSCDYTLIVLASASADELSVHVHALESAYNEAISKFLTRHGMEVPKQDERPTRWLIRPPAEPLALSSFLELMFRDVCGLNANSEVVIHQIECEAIP